MHTSSSMVGRPIRAAILDFDGTLADTKGLILAIMHATFQELGLPDAPDAQCAATIGLPLAEGFRRLVASHDDGLAERCAATYRRLFTEKNRPGLVKPFPQVAETLRSLHAKGTLLTVASSRHHESLAAYLEEFGLDGLFALVLGVNDVARAKPDPLPVLHTLHALGLREGEAIVVGDTPFDILMGRRAHCPTAAVTYGNATREDLVAAGADYVLDGFGELERLV